MPAKQNIFLPFNDKSDKHLTSPYGNRHKNKMQHFIVSIILIVMICSQKNLKFFFFENYQGGLFPPSNDNNCYESISLLFLLGHGSPLQ